mgnify:CR=1 FL=1
MIPSPVHSIETSRWAGPFAPPRQRATGDVQPSVAPLVVMSGGGATLRGVGAQGSRIRTRVLTAAVRSSVGLSSSRPTTSAWKRRSMSAPVCRPR